MISLKMKDGNGCPEELDMIKHQNIVQDLKIMEMHIMSQIAIGIVFIIQFQKK